MKRSCWNSSACGLLMLLGLGHVGCILDFDGDSETGIDRIIGYYTATTFTELGSRDQGIDIIAEGGKLTIRLSSNHEIYGRLIIPEDIDTNFAPKDIWFVGTYVMKDDTVKFSNTQTVLDWYPPFHVEDSRLQTIRWPGWMWIYSITLEKQGHPTYSRGRQSMRLNSRK